MTEFKPEVPTGTWRPGDPMGPYDPKPESCAASQRDDERTQSEEEARTEGAQWHADFEAAARRPLSVHLDYSFVRTHKPVLDDAPIRVFDTMAQYRRWCNEHLPEWLGYGTGD